MEFTKKKILRRSKKTVTISTPSINSIFCETLPFLLHTNGTPIITTYNLTKNLRLKFG